MEAGTEPPVEAAQPLTAQTVFQKRPRIAVLVIASHQFYLPVSVLAVELTRSEVGLARFDPNRRDSGNSCCYLEPVEKCRGDALPPSQRVNRHQQQMRVFISVLHDREAR